MATAQEEFRRLEGELELSDPKPMYLLYGEETYFLKRAAAFATDKLLQESLRDFNLEKLDGETAGPGEWVSRASNRPMMGNRRVVMVSNGDKWLKGGNLKADDKAALESLAAFVEKGTRSGVLVVTTQQVDKRTRLFKLLTGLGATFYFGPIKTIGEAERFLQDRLRALGISAERGVCQYLAEVIGNDMTALLSEVRRLQDFLGKDRSELTMADVQGLIAKTRTHTVFEFTEAIGDKDGVKALAVLERLLEGGLKTDRKTTTAGIPLVLMTLLSKNFRQMLLVRSLTRDHGLDQKAVIRELGVHPFVGEKLVRQSKRFSQGQLEAALAAIMEADTRLKSTSIPARLLMESLIFDLCG